jgi:hypothetical protein
LEAVKRISIKTAISKIRYIGNNIICVVDEENSVRFYSLNDYKLLDGFRIKLPKNRPLENSVDISQNGKYLAIGVNGKKKISVWDIKNKKQLFLLGWHKGDVLSVNFDRDGKYLLSGGEDGRSYLWSLETGKIVGILPPSADYVLCGDFSFNSVWMATGSYDKCVNISNLSMGIFFKKKSHKDAVTNLKFLSNLKLISGDKNGELLVWDYSQGSVLKKLTSMGEMISDIDFDEKNLFIFVSAGKRVGLYSLNEYTQISDKFIKLLAVITSIEYIPHNHSFIIGTIEGDIYFYDLLSDERELKSLINTKNYGEAYELLSKNPFLKTTKVYKSLEVEWNKALHTAHKFLEKEDIDSAKELLKHFMNVPVKRAIIQQLLKDFREFSKFKNAVINQKYSLAYSLANKYPSFKDTVYYKKMENHWKEAFNLAKKYVKNNDIEKAREVLKPFRGVSQKVPLIRALFNEKQLYDMLQEKLAKRDFKEFFLLIKKYPFLTQTEEYEKAINFAKSLNENVKEYLKRGDYAKVLYIVEILENFPGYEEKAKDYEEKAKVLMEFQRFLAQKNYIALVTLFKKYPFLEEVDDFKIFKKEIEDRFILAERYASKGDVKGIIDSLKDFINIKEFYPKIINLIKSAYLQQIISLLVEKLKGKNVDESVNKAFNNYINLFGLDSEIEDLLQKAKKLKIELNIETKEEDFESYSEINKLPLKIY